jgi:anti-sigma B factor antagonist
MPSYRRKYMMRITAQNTNSVLLVALSGKFNIEEVSKFEDSVSVDFDKNLRAVLVDFSEVEYIDSSALGSLIKIMNKAKNFNIDFVLFNLTQPILSIFKLAYLDKFFVISSENDVKHKYPESCI